MSDASATLAPSHPATAIRDLVSTYNVTARPGRRAHVAHLSLVYSRGTSAAPSAQHAHTYGLARAHAFLTLLTSGAMPVNPVAPDRDLLPPHHPLSLRAPVPGRPTRARPLTAAIIIDALGRPWKSFLHPRDRNGRFIPTFGNVQIFDRTSSGVSDKHHATGRYVGANPDGSIRVRLNAVDDPSKQDQIGRTIDMPADQVAAVSSGGRRQKASIGGHAPTSADEDSIEYRNQATQEAFQEGLDKLGDQSTPNVNANGNAFNEGDRITTQVHSDANGQDEIESRDGTIKQIATTKDGSPNALVEFDGEADQDNPKGTPEYSIIDLNAPGIARSDSAAPVSPFARSDGKIGQHIDTVDQRQKARLFRRGDKPEPEDPTDALIRGTQERLDRAGVPSPNMPYPADVRNRAMPNPQGPPSADIGDINRESRTVGVDRPAAPRLEGHEQVGERTTAPNAAGESFGIGDVVQVVEARRGRKSADIGKLGIVGNINHKKGGARLYFQDENGQWYQTKGFFKYDSLTSIAQGDVDYLAFMRNAHDSRGRGLLPSFKRIAPLQPKGSDTATDKRIAQGADGQIMRKGDHVAGVRGSDGTVIQGIVQNINPKGDVIEVIPYGGGDKIAISPNRLRWVRNASSSYTAGDREDIFIDKNMDHGAAAPDRESLEDVLIAAGFSQDTQDAVRDARPEDIGDILRADPAHEQLTRRLAAIEALAPDDPDRHSSQNRADRMYGSVVRAGEAGRLSGETVPRKPSDSQISRESSTDEFEAHFPEPDPGPGEQTTAPAPDGEEGLPEPPAPAPVAEAKPPQTPRPGQVWTTPGGREWVWSDQDRSWFTTDEQGNVYQLQRGQLTHRSPIDGEFISAGGKANVDTGTAMRDAERAIQARELEDSLPPTGDNLSREDMDALRREDAANLPEREATTPPEPAPVAEPEPEAAPEVMPTPEAEAPGVSEPAPETPEAPSVSVPPAMEPESPVPPTPPAASTATAMTPVARAANGYRQMANRYKGHPNSDVQAFGRDLEMLANKFGEVEALRANGKDEQAAEKLRMMGLDLRDIRRKNRLGFQRLVGPGMSPQDRGLVAQRFMPLLKNADNIVNGGDRALTPDTNAGFFNPDAPVGDIRSSMAASLPSGAFQRAIENGGITISLDDGTSPSEGFAYAPFKGTEEKFSPDEFTEAAVADYIARHEEELSQPGNHLGGWQDSESGDWYLDVSRVGDPNAATLQEAINAEQLAVFDLSNFAEVRLGDIGADGRYTTLYEATDHPYLNQGQDAAGSGGRVHGGQDEVRGGEGSTAGPPAGEPSAVTDRAAASGGSGLADQAAGLPSPSETNQADMDAAYRELMDAVASDPSLSGPQKTAISGALTRGRRAIEKAYDPDRSNDERENLLNAAADRINALADKYQGTPVGEALETVAGRLEAMAGDLPTEAMPTPPAPRRPTPSGGRTLPRPRVPRTPEATPAPAPEAAPPAGTGEWDFGEFDPELTSPVPGAPAESKTEEGLAGDLVRSLGEPIQGDFADDPARHKALANRAVPQVDALYNSAGVSGDAGKLRATIADTLRANGYGNWADSMTSLLVRQWAADKGTKQMEADGLDLPGEPNLRDAAGRAYSGLVDPASDISTIGFRMTLFGGSDNPDERLDAADAARAMAQLLEHNLPPSPWRDQRIKHYQGISDTIRGGGKVDNVDPPQLMLPDEVTFTSSRGNRSVYESKNDAAILTKYGSTYELAVASTPEEQLSGQTLFGDPLIEHNGHLYSSIGNVISPRDGSSKYRDYVASNPGVTSAREQRAQNGGASQLQDGRKFTPGEANWHEVDAAEYDQARRDQAYSTLMEQLNMYGGTNRANRQAVEEQLRVYLNAQNMDPDKILLPTARVVRNGNVNIELGQDTLDLWGADAEKNIALIRDKIDQLMSIRGVHDKPFSVRVSNDVFNLDTKKNTGNALDNALTLAWAVTGDHSISMKAEFAMGRRSNAGNGPALIDQTNKPGDTHFSDAVGGKNTALTSLTHEWGHATDLADFTMTAWTIGEQNRADTSGHDIRTTGAQPGSMHATAIQQDDGALEWFNYDEIYNVAKANDPTLSGYSKDSARELRAEQFAEWVESNGETDSTTAKFFYGSDQDRKDTVSTWFEQSPGWFKPETKARRQELIDQGWSEKDATWQAFRERYGSYNRSVRSHGFAYSTLVGIAGDQDYYRRVHGVDNLVDRTEVPAVPDAPAAPDVPGEAPDAPSAPAGEVAA